MNSTIYDGEFNRMNSS